MNMLSRLIPFPSILTSMSLLSSVPVYSEDVNWLPWSVLNISGLPFFSARRRARMQKSASRLFDISHEMTYLEYQSIAVLQH